MTHLQHRSIIIAVFMLAMASAIAAQSDKISPLGGTLVVAVPVQQGLVVCSDKRLYNESTNTFRDDFVKIHKVNDRAVFVATHTTGFLNKTTGKMEFDIFELTQDFVSRNGFRTDITYWNSLRDEIRKKLSAYLSRQKYADLPPTDVSNNRLLFNLVFFAVDGEGAKDYSISVFYEKQQAPIIDVSNVMIESVRNPKLLGKGKEVMALLARDPSIGSDASIMRFDQSYFRAERTGATDAVSFASRLFALTNAKLPQARVSAAHDCALLSNQTGFEWLDKDGQPH